MSSAGDANESEPVAATTTTTAAALAQEFHDAGFVALSACTHLTPSEALVARARAAVLRKYEAHVRDALSQQLDLALPKNAERLTGFYVRQGGRVDMQISALAFQKTPAAVLAAATGASSAREGSEIAVVDQTPFQEMARCWASLVREIFKDPGDGVADGDQGGEKPNYRLEYVGCVVSRPGDADQNWHLDGVHRNLTQHERADRLNVFVPLVDLSADVGGTEMKRASHFRAEQNGSAFEHYEHLESVTHVARAGTPIVMDYRVWHRGLANASGSDTIRPLLYFKYVKLQPASSADSTKRKTADAEAAAAEDAAKKTKKKKKRVVLTQVTQ